VIDYLLFVPAGYLLGSVPFGLIVGLLFRGIDVRKYGSGSTGMTNVLRTIGPPAAGLVLLLDMGKCVLAIALARILTDSTGIEAAAGLFVIIGHIWPLFSGLKGGKGTATGWGGLLYLSPVSGLVATVVGLSILATSRYVSLGSMLSAVSGTITLIVLYALGVGPLAYVWYGLGGSLLIIASHRDNIGRLLKGQERRLGQRDEVLRDQHESRRRKGLRWPRSAS